MKKFIITIVIVLVLVVGFFVFLSARLGIYPPIPIGYKNGHLIIYSFACADICPDYGHWYKKYYGKISYDQCVSMGESPKFVGMIKLDADGKPSPDSWGYDGCEVK